MHSVYMRERGGGRRRLFVYYESLKREVKTKPIYEFRCDERLKTKVEEYTRLTCTLLFIMNRQSESYRQKLYMDFGAMKG